MDHCIVLEEISKFVIFAMYSRWKLLKVTGMHFAVGLNTIIFYSDKFENYSENMFIWKNSYTFNLFYCTRYL